MTIQGRRIIDDSMIGCGSVARPAHQLGFNPRRFPIASIFQCDIGRVKYEPTARWNRCRRCRRCRRVTLAFTTFSQAKRKQKNATGGVGRGEAEPENCTTTLMTSPWQPSGRTAVESASGIFITSLVIPPSPSLCLFFNHHYRQQHHHHHHYGHL